MTVAPQERVVDFYSSRSGVADVATVGEYVRVVKSGTSGRKTCFGPVPGEDTLNWKVVEIDWEEHEFLLAPQEQ